MLKAFFLFSKDFIILLRKIPLKHLALLIVLTFASILACVGSTFKYLYGDPSRNFTQIGGFQTDFRSTNNQGIISITQDYVRIEAENNSFPKAFVYGASEDFQWNFSAIPLRAMGDSHVIRFSIEWARGDICVWADTGKGWYYSSNMNESLAGRKVSIADSVTIASRYDIEIKWDEQAQHTEATVSLKNETWLQQMIFDIQEVGIPPALTLQAWADHDASVAVEYKQSSFLTYHSRYTGESDIVVVATAVASVFLIAVTAFMVFIRLDGPFIFSKLHLEIDSPKLLSILGRLRNTFLSYVRENKSFIYLISFFAILRIALAITLPAHWFDMYAFKAWCLAINDKGLLLIYPETVVLPPIVGIRPVYPYPPIVAYIFDVLLKISQPFDPRMVTLETSLKIPPILADLSLGWVTFTAVKRWKGYKAGLVASTLSMLNIVNSSIWGQYESVVALFMVLAVLLVAEDRIELGWLCAALAVATKETALPFVPALFLVSLRKRGWFSTMLGIGVFALATLVVWSPFLLSEYSFNFALWQSGFGLISTRGAFTPASSEITRTTVFALNIWPVINLLKDGVAPGVGALATVPDSRPNQLFFFSYYQLGMLLFAIFYLLVLYRLQKDMHTQALMEKFGLLMFIFYMLPTRMHERYMFFALPFLSLAFGKEKWSKLSYGLLLVTFSISLLSALSVQWTPPDVLNLFSQYPYIGDFGVLSLSLINIFVLVLLLYKLVRGQRWSET